MLSAVIPAEHRITSYNVCYTKLLRAILLRSGELVAVLEESASATVTITSARPFDILEERFLAEGMKERFNVITSYSIHYTKLYDTQAS